MKPWQCKRPKMLKRFLAFKQGKQKQEINKLTIKVKLYTTLGCHLCEDALTLLHLYSSQSRTLEIELVEISDSDSLIERYGVRIPVIQKVPGQTELGWPFNLLELTQYIEA